jgi:starch phosphorylase
MYIISITPDLALDQGYTYAGGLGVLEGDKFYTAARMGLRYVVMTLFYRGGYVDYDFDENDNPIPKPQKHPQGFYKSISPEEEFTIKLRGEDVVIRPYVYVLRSAKAVFFDAVCPLWARSLTDRVYIEDDINIKFLKYVLLAKASAHYIKYRIGFDKVAKISLQEAYTALLPLLMPDKNRYNLIIHTPGPWGHPTFPKDVIERELGWSFTSPQVVLTEIGLSLVEKAYVVSEKQKDIIRHVFPHFYDKINYITNGIDINRWIDSKIIKLYNKKKLTSDTLRPIRMKLKDELISYLRSIKGGDLKIDDFYVAWIRRIVKYKRPEFIAKLVEEFKDDHSIKFILGGKAHPEDKDGLNMMKWFKALSHKYQNVYFIKDYDVSSAKIIIRGIDLMTFTPFSGWEACGTSYMKAGINGVPTLSSRDGGAIEIIKDGYNGWLFGRDIRDFINIYTSKLTEQINSEEYTEFKEKFSSIHELFNSQYDKYLEISLNAIKTFIPKVDIAQTLRGYYGDIIEAWVSKKFKK